MDENTTRYDTLMIGALLSIPMQTITRRVTAALLQQGFSDYRPTYQAIFQVCRPEGSRLTELAKRVGITNQSMGELIDALEQRGYVERVPDPTDGRATLIRRTPRGWQVNQVARQTIEEVQQEWTNALGEDAFRDLLHHLRHLALFLDEPLGASAPAETHTPSKSRRKKTIT